MINLIAIYYTIIIINYFSVCFPFSTYIILLLLIGSSPGGGGIFFPFFGPLDVSLRLGYLKAVSTSCWQTVSTSEVSRSYVISSLNYSVVSIPPG